MSEQPPQEHIRRHVDLLLRLQTWGQEYHLDGPTMVHELGVALAELSYKLHVELHKRLAIWEATAAQIVQHTRRN